MGKIENNKMELLEEDFDCLHRCLDENLVPRSDKSGQVLSLWGRVEIYKKMEYNAEIAGLSGVSDG